MDAVSSETPVYGLSERAAAVWSSWSSWLGKGFLALLDQGLIGSSNFLIGILLARRLLPEAYGAYALGFECFLGLSVLYACLILEPMSVFGPSLYRDCLRQYLTALLRIHLGLALIIMLLLGGAAWVAHLLVRSGGLAGALAGVTLAGPCVLLFWLARRAFYIQLAPRAAASGAALYCAVLLAGLFATYRFLSPFVAFLLMAMGALPVSLLLLIRLNASVRLKPSFPSSLEVCRQHWVYGRWALGSAAASWFSSNVYYLLLSTFRGLADTGALKALLNFSAPAGQVFSALSLLSLPYASHIHHQGGRAGVGRVAWRLTGLYAGGAIAYWALVMLFKEPIVRSLYGGKYLQVAYLLPWVALVSILRIGSVAQTIALKAMRSPSLAFVVYGAASAVALLVGVPAVWVLGLRGAVCAPVVSSATALIVGLILLRRTTRHAWEA